MKEEKPDPRLAMKFKTHSTRAWQKKYGRRASGDAEWHGRSKELRELGKKIYAFGREEEA